MEFVPSKDLKDPVAGKGIASPSATSISGQGEQPKRLPIDASSRPSSHVDTPSAVEYTAIQIDQENTSAHEEQNDTNSGSKELVVKSFSKLASYSILRHQETLAEWERRLQKEGPLCDTEIQSVRETLRIYCMP
jgi:hypothetical protein